VARIYRENDIFRAAAALEACQPWAGSKPIVSRV
jgi:hypothetical protein